MAPSSSAITRVLVWGVAAVAVPVLHLSNSRGVATTSKAVLRVARLGTPLRRFADDGLDVRIVGHVRAMSAKVGLGQTSCLARAQLAFIVLSWAGYAPVLKTGAQANIGKGGEAHAWIEIDGVAVGEDPSAIEACQNLVTVHLP